MSEAKCGNCRHWGLPDEAKQRFKSCAAVKHDKSGAVAPAYYYQEDPEYYAEELAEVREQQEIHLAVVVDGSGYHAALKCREDFGCRLFEPRGEV